MPGVCMSGEMAAVPFTPLRASRGEQGTETLHPAAAHGFSAAGPASTNPPENSTSSRETRAVFHIHDRPPMTFRKRFDYGTELRTYARDAGAPMLADRREPERPAVSEIDLALRMSRRAHEVLPHGDPAERGTFRADTVFATRKARPVRAKLPGARRVRAA